ncbi:cellulase family glycosylhydrolase [Beggiatoa alba]|nr:cellulase family glycosylhydrolase [Beggiatoa alba]
MKIRKKILFSSFLLLMAGIVQAADVSYRNDIPAFSGADVYLCNTHPGGDPNVRYTSIMPLVVPPGATFSQDSAKWSNVSVRLQGCDVTDPFIGTLNFAPAEPEGPSLIITGHKADPANNNYTTTSLKFNVAGVDIDNGIIPFPIFSPTSVRGTVVAAPMAVTLPQAPQTYQTNGLQFRGVNMSGSEFGKTWDPASSPSAQELIPYIEAGMNTFRLPIRWAYLQNEAQLGSQALNPIYLDFILSFIRDAVVKDAYVILDFHNYMRYAPLPDTHTGYGLGWTEPYPNGTQYTVDDTLGIFAAGTGKLRTGAAMGQAWVGLISAIMADPVLSTRQDYIMYDLSNEPANMQTETVRDNYTAILSAIANAKNMRYMTNYIMIEGNHFSGLHSWSSGKRIYGVAGQYGLTYGWDPELQRNVFASFQEDVDANSNVFTRSVWQGYQSLLPNAKFVLNVHQYFDEDHSGTKGVCTPWDTLKLEMNMESFAAYLEANQLRAWMGEFGAPAGGADCLNDYNKFVGLVNKHAYHSNPLYPNSGFIGWTAWSAGHAWGDYALYIGATGEPLTTLTTSLSGGLSPFGVPTLLGYINETGGSLTVNTGGSSGGYYPDTNGAQLLDGSVGYVDLGSQHALDGQGYLGMGTDAFGVPYSYQQYSNYDFILQSDPNTCGTTPSVSICYKIKSAAPTPSNIGLINETGATLTVYAGPGGSEGQFSPGTDGAEIVDGGLGYLGLSSKLALNGLGYLGMGTDASGVSYSYQQYSNYDFVLQADPNICGTTPTVSICYKIKSVAPTPVNLGLVNRTGATLTVYVGPGGSEGQFSPATNGAEILTGSVGYLGVSTKLALNGLGYLGISTTDTGAYWYDYQAFSNYIFNAVLPTDCGSQPVVSICYEVISAP